jgi:hypothetical protein
LVRRHAAHTPVVRQPHWMSETPYKVYGIRLPPLRREANLDFNVASEMNRRS